MSSIDPKYRGVIGTAVAAAAGIAVPGLLVPTLDLAGVGATWTTMVFAIASRSGHNLSSATVGKLVAAAVAAVSAYIIGSKILTWAATPLILAFPVAGVPAAAAVNAVLNGLFTLRLGLICVNHFSRASFTDADMQQLALRIGIHLIGWPSADEIRMVKEFLAD